MHSLPLAPPCPTGSKLALAFACPASVLLSRDVPDELSEDAAFGRLVHEVAEALAEGFVLPFPFIEKAPEGQRERLRGIAAHIDSRLREDRVHLRYKPFIPIREDDVEEPELWCVEPGYAYHLKTTGVRGPFEREPGAEGGPWEVCGSADLVFRRADGVLVAADWKPDKGATARVGSLAADHHQLYFLALCASRVHGASAGVRVELRYYSEEGVRIDVADLDAADLALFEADLLSLGPLGQNRLAEYPQPLPGWHCEGLHCRAHARTCSATTGMVAASGLARVTPELVQRMPRDDDEFRALYGLSRAVEAWSPEARRRLEAYVLARPEGVEVAPGVRVKAFPQKQGAEVVDTPESMASIEKAVMRITRNAGEVGNVLDAAFESRRSTGLGRLDKAVRVATAKRGADLKKARMAFRAELAAAGVIREGTLVLRVQEVRDEARPVDAGEEET